MTSERLPNRWGIATAGFCMQLCLGAAYGWSVFKNPLMLSEHWVETSVQLNFTLTFLFLGVGTIVGGLWQDRIGPRKVASIAGVLYGAGYLVAGFAASHHSLNTLYLGYGALAGTGMGLGYICAVATLAKSFPDMRGLMTGVAVCGFGFGALAMSPFAAWEIVKYGVPTTFWTLGCVYLIVVVIAAQFLTNPPREWCPPGWQPRTAVAKAAGTDAFSVSEALGTWQLYLLFLMLFVNISAGFMIISQASPIAQEMVGMPVLKAAGMVGLISIFNGLGRVFWAWVSDHIGRARAYTLFGSIQVLTFFILPRIHDWRLFTLTFALIGFCYGGSLGTMPSFVADYYGAKDVGGIYGVILFGANTAATPAAILIAQVHQTLGRYGPAINVATIVMLCSLILPLIIRRPTKRQPSTSFVAIIG